MFIIDQGEKKLIKRTLLDEENNPIPWDKIVDIIFNLTIGGNSFKKYSKAEGTVIKNGNDVSFEITQEDTNSLPPTIFDLKATIVVYDNRFTGQLTDTQWEYRFSRIRINADSLEKFDKSIDSGEMQFSVIPENIPDQGGGPDIAPTIGQPVTTSSTLSVFFSSVPEATEYEYQRESTGLIENVGAQLSVNLSGLSSNSTDRIRVRGRNIEGIGPWSDYRSFTTNPDQAPNVTNINRGIDNAVITLENPAGLDVEYVLNNVTIEVGNVTEFTISGLNENQSYTVIVRFRNDGGISQETELSFLTSEASPSTAPTITLGTINDNGASFTRTSVAGADDYEASVDGNAYSSIGLSTSYSITGIAGNTTFSHVIRAINDGGPGPDSNELTVLTLTDEAPVVTLTEATSTTLTLNVADISGDGTTTLYLNVNGAGYEVVTVGDNTFTGLPPETSITVLSRADNASGTGTEIGSYSFNTAPAITEPTFNEGNFTNSVTSFTVEFDGPNDFQFRYANVNADITQASIENISGPEPITKTVDEGLSDTEEYRVQVRSTDGVTQSAWVEVIVHIDQTDDTNENYDFSFVPA